jgi:uncharacterized protein YceK
MIRMIVLMMAALFVSGCDQLLGHSIKSQKTGPVSTSHKSTAPAK